MSPDLPEDEPTAGNEPESNDDKRGERFIWRRGDLIITPRRPRPDEEGES